MTDRILLALYISGVFYFWQARLRAESESSIFYRAVVSALAGLGWPACAIVVVSEKFRLMYREPNPQASEGGGSK